MFDQQDTQGNELLTHLSLLIHDRQVARVQGTYTHTMYMSLLATFRLHRLKAMIAEAPRFLQDIKKKLEHDAFEVIDQQMAALRKSLDDAIVSSTAVSVGELTLNCEMLCINVLFEFCKQLTSNDSSGYFESPKPRNEC